MIFLSACCPILSALSVGQRTGSLSALVRSVRLRNKFLKLLGKKYILDLSALVRSNDNGELWTGQGGGMPPLKGGIPPHGTRPGVSVRSGWFNQLTWHGLGSFQARPVTGVIRAPLHLGLLSGSAVWLRVVVVALTIIPTLRLSSLHSLSIVRPSILRARSLQLSGRSGFEDLTTDRRHGVDAIVLSACVQMPSLAAIQKVEDEVGLPVLSAVVATTHQMLTKIGLDPYVPGCGALLSGRYRGQGRCQKKPALRGQGWEVASPDDKTQPVLLFQNIA